MEKDVAGIVKENSLNGSENILSVTHCNVCTNEEWILDSSFSYHMCPNQDWFITYKAVNDKTILIGNNMHCKTVGIGIV